MKEEEVVVISAVRSPFGKFGGALKDFTLPKLGGPVAAEAIRRAGISPEDVQEVATGVNLPGADRSIARQLLIAAGIPPTRVAYTVDRACCSSMAATPSVGVRRVLHSSRWLSRCGPNCCPIASKRPPQPSGCNCAARPEKPRH